MTDEEYYNLKIGQELVYNPNPNGFRVFVFELNKSPSPHKFVYFPPGQTYEEFSFIYHEDVSFPLTVKSEKKKDNHFPHTCPKCKAPAYIGFSTIECQSKCIK